MVVGAMRARFSTALGFTDGCPVERSAVAIRSVPDRPPPIPAVAQGRRAGRDFVGVVRRPAGPRGAWAGGNLHRRLVHRGEKRGDRIGPTRCGKGSKIMAIADCHGLPIAVRVTSASPHESKLVEDTLRQRHVSALPERMIGDRGYDTPNVCQWRGSDHNAPATRKLDSNGVWYPVCKECYAGGIAELERRERKKGNAGATAMIPRTVAQSQARRDAGIQLDTGDHIPQSYASGTTIA